MLHPKPLALLAAVLLAAGTISLAQEEPLGDPGSGAPPVGAAKDEDRGGYAGYQDGKGRGEEHWVSTMGAARDKVQQLREEVARVELMESALQNEFYAKDDPYQREKVKKNWDETLNRHATVKAQLEKAEAAVEALEQEARQSGALPGWLRETREQEERREAFEEREATTGATHQVDLDQLKKDNQAADDKLYGKKPEPGAEDTAEQQAAAASEAARGKKAEAEAAEGEAGEGEEVAEAEEAEAPEPAEEAESVEVAEAEEAGEAEEPEEVAEAEESEPGRGVGYEEGAAEAAEAPEVPEPAVEPEPAPAEPS